MRAWRLTCIGGIVRLLQGGHAADTVVGCSSCSTKAKKLNLAIAMSKWALGMYLTASAQCTLYSRGLYLVSKLDGIQTETDKYLKKYLFTCCKIFENIPVFEHMHSKFARSTNMTKKFLS
jgi:hypothetical protein